MPCLSGVSFFNHEFVELRIFTGFYQLLIDAEGSFHNEMPIGSVVRHSHLAYCIADAVRSCRRTERGIGRQIYQIGIGFIGCKWQQQVTAARSIDGVRTVQIVYGL